MTTTRSGMTLDALEELVIQCVAEALANYDSNRNNRNGIKNGNGNGNGNRGDVNGNSNGNGNHNGLNGNAGGLVRAAHECTYNEFLNCQTLNFKGTERAVWLARWFEKMESVFHINNCPIRCQVKYATCTLIDSALTWWNSRKRTIGVDVAYAMTWKELMRLMTKVYSLRNEIQKMESMLWN
ncbi:hypothetical protein Tco_0663482 [Tanacetum coccineum]